MRLLELRYNKAELVDKVMMVIDDVIEGGNPQAGEILQRRGIDVNGDMDDIRRSLLLTDEYKLARLYHALEGRE